MTTWEQGYIQGKAFARKETAAAIFNELHFALEWNYGDKNHLAFNEIKKKYLSQDVDAMNLRGETSRPDNPNQHKKEVYYG